ncbi:hypothetical protein JHK82_013346 [Glycine max]|nr:hypothetical protein JHK82_013346 [Glycine max]
MSLGTSKVVFQVLSRAVPQTGYNDSLVNSSELALHSRFRVKCMKKRSSRHRDFIECSSMLQSRLRTQQFQWMGVSFHDYKTYSRPWWHTCKCQQAESVSGVTTGDGNGSRLVNDVETTNTLSNGMRAKHILEFEDVQAQQLKREKEVLASNLTNGSIKGSFNTIDLNSIEEEAWDLLRESVVYYCGNPIGTIAAKDPTSSNVLNYDQVFIRDFIPSGIAFLLKGEYDIVRNFILYTLQLQSWEKTMDCHSPGQGLMPASFKVRTVPLDGDDSATEEVLDPDFGEAAIGRVAPVDSGLWWIILLRAYGKCSGDLSVQERVDVQTGIKMILRLCLADGFDMFPTLLVTDGSCMIDRRMGIHGHPLEIQEGNDAFVCTILARSKTKLRTCIPVPCVIEFSSFVFGKKALFYSALLCARGMLTPEDGSADLIQALNNRLVALSFHIREYYWIDLKKLNEIYRYKTEEYSYDAVNKFNIYPDQISPCLATEEQSHAILDLIEAKWSDLVAEMPFKICYPALDGQEWQIITGSDPKNTPWSYHNAGSWPTLLWQLTAACIKMKRTHIAAKAVEIAERRISRDRWPEYYDTKRSRFIGKQSQLYQTWSIAGYLVAKLLLADPSKANILITEEDSELVNALISANPRGKRGRKNLRQTYIV